MASVINLFQYLPGLEVTPDELLEAELMAIQLLAARFPDIDMREGTGLRDLVVRPTATLLALAKKGIAFYFDQNTIKSVDDTTSTDFVDKLMSNWFLTRRSGNQAIINVRLYFATAKSFTLSAGTYFSINGTNRYFPYIPATYTSDQLTFDSGSGQYYIDLDLIAEAEGKDYEATTGSLLYFSNFDPYFLRGEINYLKQEASSSETNTEFLNRASSAISTRNLINTPSINSNLLEAFPIIEEIYTAGFGDAPMIRDLIKVLAPGIVNPIWIHNGGKVDIYCRVPLSSSIIQVTTDSNGQLVLTGSIYKIERSQISGGTDDDTLPFYNMISVSSITRTSTTATVATGSNHGYSSGDNIIISGATPSGYNKLATITATGLNTFTYTVDGTLTTPATGTIQCGKEIPFTQTNTNLVSVTPTSITRSSSTATVTYADHGLTIGERVLISGAGQAEYNGVKSIVDTPTKDTFTFTVTGTPATPATGTLVLKYVDRRYEVGFSDNQSLTLDFGITYANETVSLVIYYHQDLDGVQTYLSGNSNRVLCNDPLARGFNLTLLTANIVGYGVSAPDAQLANDVIKAYLTKLGPGEPFIMADLLSNLYNAGIKTIQTPITLSYTKYYKDMLGTTTGVITDVLDPGDPINIFVIDQVYTSAQTI